LRDVFPVAAAWQKPPIGGVRQPNILWIVTTQWRAMATGYAGDSNARTPWLDGLASEAVDFTQAVTPHPLGPQARAALLTGRLCPENGVGGYWDPLPVYEESQSGAPSGRALPGRTIAHALRDRGYSTAWFGKWHLSERDRSAPFVGETHAKQIVPPERRGGFEMWEGFESGFLLNDPWLHGTRLPQPKQFKGYQADVLAGRAGAWSMEPSFAKASEGAAWSETGGRPWFCVVSMEAPHPPYHAPAPNVSELAPAEIKLRPNVPPAAERQARDELAGYYAHIEATDRAIGRLLSEVDLTNTVVVFTSVHGDMHGAHGLFRKAWPYEESIRVPLLIRYPHGEETRDKGQGTRGRTDMPVSLVDLPHMAVAWAEGREWRAKGDSALISMPAPADIPHQCPVAWHGFRTAKHKLVLSADDRPWLYFDLENDPYEMKNLAENPARAGEIAELMKLL
jgi:arylsulfatase A-like enzyme